MKRKHELVDSKFQRLGEFGKSKNKRILELLKEALDGSIDLYIYINAGTLRGGKVPKDKNEDDFVATRIKQKTLVPDPADHHRARKMQMGTDAFRVSTLCEQMTSIEGHEALAKAINTVLGDNLPGKLDDNKPIFDSDLIEDAVLGKYNSSPDKVQAFLDELQEQMGDSYPPILHQGQKMIVVGKLRYDDFPLEENYVKVHKMHIEELIRAWETTVQYVSRWFNFNDKKELETSVLEGKLLEAQKVSRRQLYILKQPPRVKTNHVATGKKRGAPYTLGQVRLLMIERKEEGTLLETIQLEAAYLQKHHPQLNVNWGIVPKQLKEFHGKLQFSKEI